MVNFKPSVLDLEFEMSIHRIVKYMAEAHFAPKNTLLLGTLCFSRAEHILQPKTLCKVTNYFLAHLGP